MAAIVSYKNTARKSRRIIMFGGDYSAPPNIMISPLLSLSVHIFVFVFSLETEFCSLFLEGDVVVVVVVV